MQRSIKFRAWDKQFGGWLDYIYIDLGGTTHWRTEGGNYGATTPNVELMQFTGLLDKNGKEIYEGDIVNLYHYTDDYHECLARNDSYSPQVIRWMFSMSIPHWALTDTKIWGMEYVGGFDKLEVIGNLWENPELSKETNEDSV